MNQVHVGFICPFPKIEFPMGYKGGVITNICGILNKLNGCMRY